MFFQKHREAIIETRELFHYPEIFEITVINFQSCRVNINIKGFVFLKAE